ncbi:MAG: heavy metal-associated domain-containing protein [Bdellovibrionota bacterium]
MKLLLILTLLGFSASSFAKPVGEQQSPENAVEKTTPLTPVPATPNPPAQVAGKVTYEVKGMHCEACEASIKEKVCALPNLQSCEVRTTDSNKKIGEVVIVPKEGTKLKDSDVKKAVKSAGGFKVTEIHR